VESSNEISEDGFYDFVARGDFWYDDSTRDLVGDFGAACMSWVSKSPILKHNPPNKKDREGGRLGWTAVRINSHESDLHSRKAANHTQCIHHEI